MKLATPLERFEIVQSQSRAAPDRETAPTMILARVECGLLPAASVV